MPAPLLSTVRELALRLLRALPLRGLASFLRGLLRALFSCGHLDCLRSEVLLSTVPPVGRRVGIDRVERVNAATRVRYPAREVVNVCD